MISDLAVITRVYPILPRRKIAIDHQTRYPATATVAGVYLVYSESVNPRAYECGIAQFPVDSG